MLRSAGKDTAQIPIITLRGITEIESLLLPVMLGKSAGQQPGGIDLQAASQYRLLSADLLHQLIDVLQFLQRRPGGITLAPVGARRQPDSESFGEVLIRM